MADLMRQGFMKPRPEKKTAITRPTVACERCQDWHPEGKHSAPSKPTLIALAALMLGEPYDEKRIPALVRKDWAHWIGGSLFITDEGRQILGRYAR